MTVTITDAIESVFEKNGIDLNPREIMAALKRAGYAIVPRVATAVMVEAANELPVTDQVNGLIAMTGLRQGGITGLPIPPNSPLEQWWAAMVAAAENGT